MRYPHAGTALETVSTGFVKRFTGPYIGENLLFRYCVKSDISTVISGQDLPVRGENSDAGVNLVALSGKEAQHPDGVVSIRRFAENLIAQGNQGISREDRAAGIPGRAGRGFAAGQDTDRFGSRQSTFFINVGSVSPKSQPEPVKEFTPARGTGRENQTSQTDHPFQANLKLSNYIIRTFRKKVKLTNNSSDPYNNMIIFPGGEVL
jgi:hypothetical protein